MPTKTAKNKKRWISPPPEKCDICDSKITSLFIDGKTSMGPWAFMCKACHSTDGCGLGLGKGQLFEYDKTDGIFYLTKGGSGLG